jgi:hypothetical protein
VTDRSGATTFVVGTGLLEPGERIDTEVTFVLDRNPSLLGVKVEEWVERGAWQIALAHLLHHRQHGWNPLEPLYWSWGSFLFIDPSLKGGRGRHRD